MSLKNQAIQTALMGNWENAVAINLEILAETPEDIDTLNRLALAYTVLGKTREAKDIYQKVFEIDPLNSIALRNLKRIKESQESSSGCISVQLNNNFLEETGKTKVVELVNIAQPKIVQILRTGQSVNLCIKRSKIFILEGEKQYIGVLPDDIGRRLIKLMNSGNKYVAYIKSSNPNKVQVFIKEIKRSSRYKFHPSFLSTSETIVPFDKGNKIKSHQKEEEKAQSDED